MTNNQLSYGRTREKIAKIAEKNPLFEAMMSIDDVDGVINSPKSLEFCPLAVAAYVALQRLFKNCQWLTGRFAQLMANKGIPLLKALGWDFSQPCGYTAEMGGVTMRPVLRISKPERDLTELIVPDSELQFVDDEWQWAAIANAPRIGDAERKIIYEAYKRVLGRYIKTGKLMDFGIDRSQDIDVWAGRIYDAEEENFFKGTVTTSMVPPEWKDLARAIHDVIGDDVAIEINKDLQGYNSTANRKLEAVKHLDCIEVLFEGINKFNTTVNMIRNFEAESGIQLKTIVTKGDAYKDIHMAQAAVSLQKTSIHFHFGHVGNFKRDLRADIERGNFVPDYIVLFPQYDRMWEDNPGLASVNTSATSLWSFIDAICENPDIDDWYDLLSKINNAEVIPNDQL